MSRNTLITEVDQETQVLDKKRLAETTASDTSRAVVAAARKGKDVATPAVTALARQKTQSKAIVPQKPKLLSENEGSAVARLQAEFLHACLPLFFAEQNPIHTLGLTSAVAGEGKTLASLLVSHALATSSRRPVVLVECDWQRPSFSKDLGLPDAPGLAEWLCGTSNRNDIRQHFIPNLTIVSAGQGGADAITALAELQRTELHDRLANPEELMILDLPPILGSYYGTIAARLADTLLMVVRAGSTSASLVTRACDEVQHLHIEGIVLNQVKTSIPRWIQSLL